MTHPGCASYKGIAPSCRLKRLDPLVPWGRQSEACPPFDARLV